MVFALLSILWGGACQRGDELCACAQRSLRLATTTSVDNTGLLADIVPPFGRRTGIRVQTVAVGTGQALRLAENGDADAVLVHDAEAELAFLRAGFGINRRAVMHNDFVLLGPASDPAAVSGTRDAAAAMARIAASGSHFVSRGDMSGTHRAEQRLWRAGGLAPWEAQPAHGWYFESGQGQRMMLQMAHEKQAYCLCDRATFVFSADRISLQVLVEGDPRLHNPYSVICTSPAKHPKAHYVEAMAFAGWLTSAECQARIGRFRISGQILFHPDAVEP
ncbi:MAG: substrate-binding domain-containing protein [Deltaproteobacteria bacterium]|nr:substrate-binding domain-containing protein [Deltaproteobacteria bacterium]